MVENATEKEKIPRSCEMVAIDLKPNFLATHGYPLEQPIRGDTDELIDTLDAPAVCRKRRPVTIPLLEKVQRKEHSEIVGTGKRAVGQRLVRY